MVYIANRELRTKFDAGMTIDQICDALNRGLYIGTDATEGSLQVFPQFYGGTSNGSASRSTSAAGALFYDDFLRDDTSVGSIGIPESGEEYVISTPRGSSNLAGAIWVSTPGTVIYATQGFENEVTSIGAKVRWRQHNGVTDPGVFAMLISPTENLYATNSAIHVTLQRTTWIVQVIVSGVFTTIASGTFTPSLDYDKWYSFEVNLSDVTVHFNMAGVVGSADNVAVKSLLGKFATWEHYYASSNVNTLVECSAVWAGGCKMIPNFPMHGDSNGIIYANGAPLTFITSNLRRFYGGGTSGYDWQNTAGSQTVMTLSDVGDLSPGRSLLLPASTTVISSLRIPHGVAPTSPVNGDVWTDANGAYVRINGVTKTIAFA